MLAGLSGSQIFKTRSSRVNQKRFRGEQGRAALLQKHGRGMPKYRYKVLIYSELLSSADASAELAILGAGGPESSQVSYSQQPDASFSKEVVGIVTPGPIVESFLNSAN
jgi:hypothetical protein